MDPWAWDHERFLADILSAFPPNNPTAAATDSPSEGI
jgi:hypothetical protein